MRVIHRQGGCEAHSNLSIFRCLYNMVTMIQFIRQSRPAARLTAVLAGILIFAAVSFFISCGSTPPVEDVPKTAELPEDVPVTEDTSPVDATPVDTSSEEYILTEISRALSNGEQERALALFDTLKPEDAEKTGIKLLKASVLVSAGKLDDARNIVTDIAAAEPDNAEAFFSLSFIEGASGNERAQRAALEKIISIDPDNAEAYASLGNIAMGNRSYRNAKNYFNQALQAESGNPDALVGMAALYFREDNPKNAEALLNRAIRLYPAWSRPLVERAKLYDKYGYPEDALKDFDKAKELSPNDYYIAVDRGNLLIDLRRMDEALAEFNRAIEINPDNFLAYVFSAGIKDDRGDYEGAEKDYAALIKLRPDYYFAFEGYGILKMRNSQWTEARDAFAKASSYVPKDYSYALLTAANSMRAGRMSDPKTFLARALPNFTRDTIEWYMLRLYHDLNGDSDVAMRIDRERDQDKKAQMLYHLASYYDIRGNKNLADTYYLAMRDLDRKGILEWKLNEIALGNRGIIN